MTMKRLVRILLLTVVPEVLLGLGIWWAFAYKEQLEREEHLRNLAILHPDKFTFIEHD